MLAVVSHADLAFCVAVCAAMVLYVGADLLLGSIYGRCVVPGLKCKACRTRGWH